jgi:hypothetical protein
MPTQSFESSWKLYQQAVKDLYSGPAKTTERGSGEISPDGLQERAEIVLNRSEEVRDVLANSLESDDLDQRQLGTLKLLAAAVHDLSVASDLLLLEETGPQEEPERGGRGLLMGAVEIRSVLDAPMSEGMAGLLKDDIEREAVSTNPETAKAALQEIIKDYVKEITKGAGDLSIRVVIGAGALGLAPVQGAISGTAQEILSRVPSDVSIAVRYVGKLLVESIRKIQTAFGGKQSESAQKESIEWLEKFRAASVEKLLRTLYETDQIEQEVQDLIDESRMATATPFNKATKRLKSLQAGYKKSQEILTWGVRIISVAHQPLMVLTPWGPLAVYVTYALVLSYTVCSGGDHLDWYRTESLSWLDRVEGLRTAVRECLQT